MRKMLTFIPLGIGISAALIYVFNIIQFKMTSDALTLLEALSKLKIYLYIAISGFVIYFLIKLFVFLFNRNNKFDDEPIKYEEPAYEPFEEIKTNNYEEIQNEFVKEPVKVIENINVVKSKKYCNKCNNILKEEDKYCSFCGYNQEVKNDKKNTFIKNVINIIEIIILILILYFLLSVLFDYKEKQDPNFKSPFNISVTK